MYLNQEENSLAENRGLSRSCSTLTGTKIDCTLLESNLETFNIFAAQVPATLLKRRDGHFFSVKEKLQTAYKSTLLTMPIIPDNENCLQ